MPYIAEYAGLFMAAFLSATLLPAQSEAVLFAMLVSERYQEWLLIAVASAGNTLGSAVNWLAGRFIARLEGRPWFPVRREVIARAEGWYRRYGRYSLLLSWVPVIGDPLTLVAGILREPFPVFLLLVAVAKTARYAALGALSMGWG